MKRIYGFGQHLMLDGYMCDKNKLIDLNLIYNFLDDYPLQMKMTKVMPPYVFKCEGQKPDDWGYSGFVIIAESHISIHTFPEKKYLSLDIFSCKTFDAQKAISNIVKLFDIKKKEVRLLDRGIEFPRNLTQTAEIVSMKRKAIS
jgi:S-adenosylmethionine decarboxylase